MSRKAAGAVQPLVRQLLREQYGSIDACIPKMMGILADRGADECWHKHSTFKQHLVSVWKIMTLWGQRPEAARAGLCHSAYSNSYVNLKVFDAATDRAVVAAALGRDAEATVLLWCSIDRRQEVVGRLLAGTPASLQAQLWAGGLPVTNLRNGQRLRLSPRQVAELLVFEMADAADQQFGWQDGLMGGAWFRDPGPGQHQPWRLWPGESRPGLWMATVSRMAALVRAAHPAHPRMDTRTDHTEAHGPPPPGLGPPPPGLGLPPVFDGCTAVLDPVHEEAARDLYWSVCTAEGGPAGSPQAEEAIEKLAQVSALNPFIGEPHLLRAQLLLDKAAAAAHEKGEGAGREGLGRGGHGGGYGGSGTEGSGTEGRQQQQQQQRLLLLLAAAGGAAEKGLALLAAWGTPWDKRMGWEAWVAWARVLSQRAAAAEAAATTEAVSASAPSPPQQQQRAWPTDSWDVINMGLVHTK